MTIHSPRMDKLTIADCAEEAPAQSASEEATPQARGESDQSDPVPSVAPPPAARRAPRLRVTLQERRRGPSRHLVVDTLTHVRTSQNLPMVVQTADTLSRLRKSGWDDLKTPTPLPSVPLNVESSSDEDHESEDWIRRAFSADAFLPAPDMMSTDYQSFPVMMELQCYSPPPGMPRPAPLFLIHPNAGFSVAFLGIPNLSRPVYGLSNTYLANGLAFKSIHCAAQIYLKHIRGVAREGPYLLGGVGVGGSIAREAAAILSQEWADHEAEEEEQTREAKRASRRVFVLMIDSYNDSWSPFKEPIPLDQAPIGATTVQVAPPTPSQSPNARAQRKLLRQHMRSPCYSPSGLSFADRCIVTNAALKAFAAGTMAHLKDQYRLWSKLTREEDPLPFAHRSRAVTRYEAGKLPAALRLDSFAHVFLLKAGRLGAFAPTLSYEDRTFFTRRFLSSVNGWADPELAPGLSAPAPGPTAGPGEAGLRGNVVNSVMQVQTIPFTHSDMLCPAACEQVGQWLRACLAAANV